MPNSTGSPQLLDSLAQEFGRDEDLPSPSISSKRNAPISTGTGGSRKMNLGAYESFDDEDKAFELVSIVGYFRGRCYVATCIVNTERHVHWMFHCVISTASRAPNSGGVTASLPSIQATTPPGA